MTVGDFKRWLEENKVRDDARFMVVCSREDDVFGATEFHLRDVMFTEYDRWGFSYFKEVDKESIGSLKGIFIT